MEKVISLLMEMKVIGESSDKTECEYLRLIVLFFSQNLTAWHGGDALVLAVAAQNNNTIVIVNSVGPLIIEPWIDHPNVTAVRLIYQFFFFSFAFFKDPKAGCMGWFSRTGSW